MTSGTKGKVLVVFDNELGPIAIHATPMIRHELLQKIALGAQMSLSMCIDWGDSLNAIVPVNDLIVYVYFFNVATDQAERFKGSTLASLCYYFPVAEQPKLYTRVAQLTQGAQAIHEVLKNTFVYHGKDSTIPRLAASLIEKWN